MPMQQRGIESIESLQGVFILRVIDRRGSFAVERLGGRFVIVDDSTPSHARLLVHWRFINWAGTDVAAKTPVENPSAGLPVSPPRLSPFRRASKGPDSRPGAEKEPEPPFLQHRFGSR